MNSSLASPTSQDVITGCTPRSQSRAERALRCAPFYLDLFRQMQQASVLLPMIASEAGIKRGFCRPGPVGKSGGSRINLAHPSGFTAAGGGRPGHHRWFSFDSPSQKNSGAVPRSPKGISLPDLVRPATKSGCPLVCPPSFPAG